MKLLEFSLGSFDEPGEGRNRVAEVAPLLGA